MICINNKKISTMLRANLYSPAVTASYRNAVAHMHPVTLARPCAHTTFRLIGTSSISRNNLTSKTSQAESTTPHAKDLRVKTSQPADVVDQTPSTLVRGDWVLFHPVYTNDELRSVKVLHKQTSRWTDKAAYGMVLLARKMFDIVSGYKHKDIPADTNMSVEELRKKGYILDHNQWLTRILFLETIAGVPGMVAAALRHLTSLRLMRRDSGWIHTCLEEAENERMHLMTFMTLRKPSLFFRAIILGAQGVFYNLFFLAYLISPRICHRFVGYLEEEAVRTYTICIADLEAGRIPEWTNAPAPEIAIDYWRLAPDAKLLDVIYAVRSDESTHRFVNHSLANLNQKTDVNPFALREPDMHTKGTQIDFDRTEAEKFVLESHALLGKADPRAVPPLEKQE